MLYIEHRIIKLIKKTAEVMRTIREAVRGNLRACRDSVFRFHVQVVTPRYAPATRRHCVAVLHSMNALF